MPVLQRLSMVCSDSARKSFLLHSRQKPLLNKCMHSGHQRTETLLCDLYLPSEVLFIFYFCFCTTREILHSAPLGKHRCFMFQLETLPPASSLLHFFGSLSVFAPALTSCHEIFITAFAFVRFSAGVPSAGGTHGMRIKNSHVWFGEKPETLRQQKPDPNYKNCTFFVPQVELFPRNSSYCCFLCVNAA